MIPSPTYIVVGLGNPGYRYRKTRHNIGFMVVNRLARHSHARFRSADLYQYAEVEIEGQRIVLTKPTTYMNRSGLAGKALIERYRIESSRLLVLCDDLNLPLGRLRLRISGTHGGNNGLASMIEVLGTKHFPRLRLGIGLNEKEASRYVLTPFHWSERRDVRRMLHDGESAVLSIIKLGLERTMNTVNQKSSPSYI